MDNGHSTSQSEALVDRVPSTDPPAASWREVLALFGAFVAFSLVQSPVPGVNEPHYLSKALHYWQPEWCRGDLFLESSNPHLFFYQTFGTLTPFGLPLAAYVGRIIGLFGLAWSWTRLARTLTGRSWLGFVAAASWLLLTAWVNFSGEWVVGGLEAKVFAYVGLFAGVDCLARRRWRAAAAWLGAAVSFHPVVGCWTVLCLTPVIAWELFQSERLFAKSFWLSRRTLTILLVFAACSAPGMIPALQLVLFEPADPVAVRDADYIQVFHRLAHHLDPMRFPARSYLTWGALAVGLSLLVVRDRDAIRRSWSRRVWLGLVAGSILVAVVGIGLGLGPRPAIEMPGFTWRGKLLKFYPFRLVDALLPLAVMLAVARELAQRWMSVAQPRRLLMLGAVLFATAIATPMASRNPSRMPPEQWAAWTATCGWIRTETRPHDTVWTPRIGWGFKWFAERSEYYSPKDCPQEAQGILEWFQRAREVKDWEMLWKVDGQIEPGHLVTIGTTHDVQWLVVPAELEVPAAAAYRNDWFAVYPLPQPPR